MNGPLSPCGSNSVRHKPCRGALFRLCPSLSLKGEGQGEGNEEEREPYRSFPLILTFSPGRRRNPESRLHNECRTVLLAGEGQDEGSILFLH